MVIGHRQTPVKAFLSYSHDSADHKRLVLELANQLRADGIDATLDQYEDNPLEGWTLWMEKQIRDADFVIVVCTSGYLRRVMKEEAPGKGLGGCWEAHIIYQYLFDEGATNWRFLPVLFPGAKVADIPRPLRSFARYDLNGPTDYESLYRRLTNQKKIPKPPLGKIRVLPRGKHAS